MKHSATFATFALIAAAGVLTACGSSDSATENRNADVTAACTQSLHQKQKNLGLKEAKPQEDTTKIVTDGDGWKMTGEVYALKDTSGEAGTVSTMSFECTAKDVNGKIEATAFMT